MRKAGGGLALCHGSETRGEAMGSASDNQEVSMDSAATQPSRGVTSVAACTHSRLIDNVLTGAGKWTGKVVCRECGVRFDDPCRELK